MPNEETEGFVELEFSLSDASYPAMRISDELDCRLELLEAVRPDDSATIAFFHVVGASAEAVVEHGRPSEHATDLRVLERYDDGCLVEATLTDSLFATLSNEHVPLRSLDVADGRARFVATLPPGYSPERIISLVERTHPDASLVGKRTTALSTPFATRSALQATLDERLTDRQWTALSLAFEAGYFERPRDTTQRTLGERMDISPSTFGQHLHTALRKLLDTVVAARRERVASDDGST
ncbi:MAG: bacterio-opsin activator domain-containing protein [Halarchaeum sp.]